MDTTLDEITITMLERGSLKVVRYYLEHRYELTLEEKLKIRDRLYENALSQNHLLKQMVARRRGVGADGISPPIV